jgi:hypothetical protein
VNLELPFVESSSAELDAELDEYLARIDRELDALFLEAVAERLERIRVEVQPAADAAA